VFQFPHIPGPPRMHLNRQLLAGFFRSAVPLMEPGATVQVCHPHPPQTWSRGQGTA
jgi:hypothetical protein